MNALPEQADFVLVVDEKTNTFTAHEVITGEEFPGITHITLEDVTIDIFGNISGIYYKSPLEKLYESSAVKDKKSFGEFRLDPRNNTFPKRYTMSAYHVYNENGKVKAPYVHKHTTFKAASFNIYSKSKTDYVITILEKEIVI